MTQSRWPDPLQSPDPSRVQQLLSGFWLRLAALPDLITRREYLLAEQNTSELRAIVIEMMLALNGIQPPGQTRHLNSYLGESQRAALEKTLIAANVSGESWIAQAVALVVIYRWYAPQLVAKFELMFPAQLEQEVWSQLQSALPEWPVSLTTE
jgi:hypothetical protein